jgi:cytochrome c oxidase subunit 1
MLGTDRLSLPRLNLLGFYLYFLGGLMLVSSLLSGGIEGTWMMLPPFSTQATGGNLIGLLGVALVGTGLVCLSLVFLVSFHRSRSQSWGRLRPFAWAIYCSSLLSLLSFPVLIGLVLLLVSGHFLGGSVFEAVAGGDAELYRTIFWIFARPAFYAVILPPIGVISEILDSRRSPQFSGDRILFGAMGAVAVFGLFGAGAHWVTAGMPGTLVLLSGLLNILTVIPFFLILIRWLQVLVAYRDQWGAPLVFALVGVFLAVIGGLSGLILSGPGGNPHIHATLFVVGHLHYLFAGTVLAAYIGGLHFWWVRLMGREFSEGLGVAGAIVLFAGVNITFLPQFAAGVAGLPRRLADYPAEFGVYQVLSTAGMTLLLVGYLLPILYLTWSLRFGERSRSGIFQAQL